jgi:Outer membrane protein beta-barrel domain
MLRRLLLLAALTLVVPALVRADAVYYSKSGASGIQSVSGTIVRETSSVVEVRTEDGHTVSIPRSNVFQIIRGAASPTAHPEVGTGGAEPDNLRHMGVKGGMNISNVSADPQDLEDSGSLQSYAFGAWWGIPLNRHVTIQPEAYYSVKGDAETSGGYTSSTRISYVDVPVLVKLGFLQDAPARPSLFLGPSMGVNLAAKATLEGPGTSVDVDVKDRVHPLELAFVVGGGLDFPVAGRTFGVDVRYSRGLNNVADGVNGTGYNSVLAIMGSVGLQ